MQQDLIIAIFAGLGGMIGWGLADFFAKKTIDAIGDIVSLGWGHIFGTLGLLIALIYRYSAYGHSVAITQSPATWLGFAFFGVLQAVVYLLVYKGFAKGQVGVLSPVFASFSGLTAFISIVFFGESVGILVILGLLVLFAGILIINIDPSAFANKRISFITVPGFKEVGLATILAVVWTLSWKQFVTGQDWLLYAFMMYAFMTLSIVVIAFIQKIDLKVSTSNSVWIFLIGIGVAEAIAYLAISNGYSTTSHTSVVALLSGAFSLPTIFLARTYLKERVTKMQAVGMFVTIIGIMILVAI
jgi:drug/metabolite transporter (DMT)-like permease